MIGGSDAAQRWCGLMPSMKSMRVAPPFLSDSLTPRANGARRAALALENARLYGVAQDAIEARDKIMGVVAHDLRNPLNAIVLQTSLLRELEPRFQRSTDTIERSAKRMNRLIQDLLDVTRMEAGHLPISQARVILSMSQMMTRPSSPVVAKRSPLGWIAMRQLAPAWASNGSASRRAVCLSHRCSLP